MMTWNLVGNALNKIPLWQFFFFHHTGGKFRGCNPHMGNWKCRECCQNALFHKQHQFSKYSGVAGPLTPIGYSSRLTTPPPRFKKPNLNRMCRLKGRFASASAVKGAKKTENFQVLLVPGYAILMRPNKAETAVHGCHCSGDTAVRIRKVLAIPGSCHTAELCCVTHAI